MKIVLLLGNDSAPVTWFANHIHKSFPVALAVLEKPLPKEHTESLVAEEKKGLSEKILSYLLFRIRQRKERKREIQRKHFYTEQCNMLYGNEWQQLNPEIKVLECADINSIEVEKMLAELEADVILDHGTSLVKSNIIDQAPLALNLHWGLSPYYRGVDCTIRALLNWDPYNIGVTVHKLAKKIDGGEILAQKRIEIINTDTSETIPLKLTFEGTHELIKILGKIVRKEALSFHSQNEEMGFLCRGIQWNQEQYYWIKNLSKKQMAQILSKPSRKAAPIIELN